MPPPLPTLPDELLEEVFLRLPPDEPESLVRASLAIKLWLGRLTDPRFHARYSEHHGAAPMLGFFQSGEYRRVSEEDFVSTTKFPVCIPNPAERGCSKPYFALDCRHGRLLLADRDMSMPQMHLSFLDTITGCRRELSVPGRCYPCFGAVLCAVNGCDHRACHGGPSRVVFVGQFIHDHSEFPEYACAYESLSETADSRFCEWSKTCSGLYVGPDAEIEPLPPVLVQDALYFTLHYYDDRRVGILKYDLCSKCLSLIDAPCAVMYDTTMLMGMEDVSLGFAHLDRLTLNLWSRQMGSDGVESWSECKVIDLKELLPVPKNIIRLIGSVEGAAIIFVTTKLGIYKINLKTLECKKIWKKETSSIVIPYMRFIYPQAIPPEEQGETKLAQGHHHGRAQS